MGGRETGGLAHLLPGYRKVADAEDRARDEAHWGLPAGLDLADARACPPTELFEALEDGRVKAVWIVATNPAVSHARRRARFAAALRRAELVIVPGRLPPDRDDARSRTSSCPPRSGRRRTGR